MNSAEILELLKYGEHINLECKKAESNLPKSIWETYSSFANTDGGVILFGVEEHMKEIDTDKRFSFVSIHNPEQRLNISRYESHRYAFEIHQYTQVIHP